MNQIYRTNRTWSDRFLPQIKGILGTHLIEAAPDQLDQQQATDLLMLDARDLRVAARVRRPGYAVRYPYEITLRSRLPSGAETELSKIVNGKGDVMFYGHANGHGDGFDLWWLIDLNAFRAGLIRSAQNGYSIRCGNCQNPDGTWFKWFDLRSFPDRPRLILASGEKLF